MLGVQDKYNICLLPFDVLVCLCRIFLRYIIIPIIQIENSTFKHMVTVMLEGMSSYLPHMSYEYQMFLTKRLVGIPGYQYHVDKEKEILSRSLFTQSEIDEMNEIIFSLTKSNYLTLTYDIPIIDINPSISINNTLSTSSDLNGTYTIKIDENSEEVSSEEISKQVELKIPDNITIRYINYEREWQTNLNDSKFYEVSSKTQRLIKWNLHVMLHAYENSIGRYLAERVISLMMYMMKRASRNYKNCK